MNAELSIPAGPASDAIKVTEYRMEDVLSSSNRLQILTALFGIGIIKCASNVLLMLTLVLMADVLPKMVYVDL